MSHPPPAYRGDRGEQTATYVALYNRLRWIDTEPGDWANVPEGGIHAF